MKDILEKRYPERTKYELPFDPPEQIEEIKKEENKENKEKENKTKIEIKKDAKIDFNLTKNEFYMDSIFVQKKKELEIKYKNKIAEYKKAIWRLFLTFKAYNINKCSDCKIKICLSKEYRVSSIYLYLLKIKS